MSNGGVDRVLCNVALDPSVVVALTLVFSKLPPLSLHLCSRLPRPSAHLPDAPHGLGVGRHDGDSAHVMQHILGSNGGTPDARFGKGDVLGNVGVEVVAHHEHVDVFVNGIASVGAGRIGGRWNDVGVAADGDNVRGVPSAGSLRVVRVDGPSLEGSNRILHAAALVEGVGVDGDLDVVLLGSAESTVNGTGGSAPVFVKLEASSTSSNHFLEAVLEGGVALAGESKVERKRVGSLNHATNVPCSVSAGSGIGASCGPRTPSIHGSEPSRDGLIGLLRTDVVNVGVQTPRSDDASFAGNDFGSHSHSHSRSHSVHDLGVACLANRLDHPILDPNVALVDACVIDHEGVGEDAIERIFGIAPRHLAHRLPQNLATPKLALIAVGRKILLDFSNQSCVSQLHLIPLCRAIHLCI
mmetsp:Transcript_4918/g.11772  ORF Transcript_4918/g.11772 Transcript_4918/m.11772 type:complete len:412 (-) Transcript_4918:759-1994(-)